MLPGRLSRNPTPEVLLREKARIDLLDWNYSSAFPILLRLSELEPDRVDLELDLALAYFERGESENRSIDYGSAVEVLSRVLAKHPDDRVALFNRALVHERMMNYRSAITDWEAYLRLESKGGWADEARRRLEEIRKRLSAKNRVDRPCPTLTANELLEWRRQKALSREIERLEGGMDCLRNQALTEWLPRFFETSSQSSSADHEAFETAATFFRDSIGDTWLLNLSRATPRPKAELASGYLAEAVRANLAVDAGRAEQAARQARTAFAEIGNQAEKRLKLLWNTCMRSEVSKRGSECKAISERLLPEVRPLGGGPRCRPT